MKPRHTKYKKHFIYFVLGIVMVFITSCSSAFEEQTEHLQFGLLKSSIHKIPYEEGDTIIFLDSLENELEFKVIDYHYGQNAPQKPVIVEDAASNIITHYFSHSEAISFFLCNDSLDIVFEFILKSKPVNSYIKEKRASDELDISIRTGGPKYDMSKSNQQAVNSEFTSIMDLIVDVRDSKRIETLNPIDSLRINDKVFYDTYKDNNYPEKYGVYFNFNKGLVSFLDFDKKRWVLSSER